MTFRDVKSIKGLSEHGDVDAPLSGLASAGERHTHALDDDAYCIVTNHGNGPDGALVFVVARRIEIEPLEPG